MRKASFQFRVAAILNVPQNGGSVKTPDCFDNKS